MSTPDWLVALAAADLPFEGIVTTDPAMLKQEPEAVTLSQTRLSVVTWRERIDDAVVLWGSLIAYMPQVLRRIDDQGPVVVLLPVPSLSGVGMVRRTSGLAGEVAALLGRSVPELKAEHIPRMKRVLEKRGLQHLAGPLDTRVPRPPE